MKSGAGVWVGRECSLAANGFGVGWSGRGGGGYIHEHLRSTCGIYLDCLSGK